jgi:hypothetical protein
MEKLEKVARAMAQADGIDPDQPITGFHRTVEKLFLYFAMIKISPRGTTMSPSRKSFIAASASLNEE